MNVGSVCGCVLVEGVCSICVCCVCVCVCLCVFSSMCVCVCCVCVYDWNVCAGPEV